MLQIVFALLAGVLTIAAPCTLPVLPVLLGASLATRSRWRPVLIALGFVATFAAATLVFSALTGLAGLDPNALRTIAIGLMALFGLVMLWPAPFERLTTRALRRLMPAGLDGTRFTGQAGGLVLGATLGLVWTPCAGPVLGSILTLIATTPDDGFAAGLLVVYALGAALPMLAIAYGGQAITARVRGLARIAPRLQQGFGVLAIGVAAAMYLQYDTLIVLWLSDLYPAGRVGL